MFHHKVKKITISFRRKMKAGY